MAGALALAAVLTLSGCGGSGTPDAGESPSSSAGPSGPTATTPSAAPTTYTSQSAEPSTSPSTDDGRLPDPKTMSAADVADTWRNREQQWVLRLKPGGRFVEDYNGVKHLRTGTWEVDNGRFSLKGGDGNTLQGRFRDSQTLVLNGSVLKRG